MVRIQYDRDDLLRVVYGAWRRQLREGWTPHGGDGDQADQLGGGQLQGDRQVGMYTHLKLIQYTFSC